MMITLHGIRQLAETVYEMDVEEEGVREWLRIDFERGIIVPKGAWAATRAWLLRPLSQVFAAFLRGKTLEYPLRLKPH